jgi:hypothetical protein
MSGNAMDSLINEMDERADQRETAQREWKESIRPLGLVERLRNGGQSDLADIATDMLAALICANTVHYLLATEIERLGCGARHVPELVRQAIAKAEGK